MSRRRAGDDLLRLARLHGVETEWRDMQGRRVRPSTESLLGALRALGVPVERPDDAAEALRADHRERRSRILPPCHVAWLGEDSVIPVVLPEGLSGAELDVRVETETGRTIEWLAREPLSHAAGTGGTEGAGSVRLDLPLPSGLPMGRHRVVVRAPGVEGSCWLLASPPAAWVGEAGRDWGVFVPLYALRSSGDTGSGDLGDLQDLLDWTCGLGGRVVSTLPLLASFVDAPSRDGVFDPSPYAPVSRLFWNEFFLDLDAAPELRDCVAAREVLSSDAFLRAAAVLRREELVDYARVQALRRRVLDPLSQAFFRSDTPRRRAFEERLARDPRIEDYARFRAACRGFGRPWTGWPGPARDGRIADGEVDEGERRLHLYGQWLAEEQISGLARRAESRGGCLYLDLPVGVHRHGYDVWSRREIFALGASSGAPPDSFFTGGQDWRFPPVHPQRSRETGHAYLADCLRHHMSHARMLRVDHVMGLHRLFWIPEGMGAREGVYVRYPAEEIYAVHCIESHRARSRIVGEDLGTVPPEVPAAMRRRRLARMFVLQYEARPDARRPLPAVAADSVASLNTHDMYPFAAWWEGEDIEQRRELGLLDPREAGEERRRRHAVREGLIRLLQGPRPPSGAAPGAPEAMRGCLERLAASEAGTVMVNLEDLWGERLPQNLPGCSDANPNWRRKVRFSLEEIERMREVREPLKAMDLLRRRAQR